MARRRKAEAVMTINAGRALRDDEQVLAERVATCEADLVAARAAVVRLRGAQDQALRDGAGSREKALAMVGDILVAERTIEVLERERAVLSGEELALRARREAEALREFGRQVAQQVQGLANAAAAVDARLGGLRDELAHFTGRLEALFAATAGILPQPAAVGFLGRWMWWDTVGEVVGRLLFELRGRGTVALPLGTAGQRFAGPVSNPAAIIASIARDLRRPEALARRFEGAPALTEAVQRALTEAEGSEHHAQTT
ncbi:MAG: hypothetical protein RDU83_06230 [bacterium]|nr:hypothetical protein [bacterium]